MEEKEEFPPKDNMRFPKNIMTNILETVTHTLGLGMTYNKVHLVKWTSYTRANLVHSKGILHAALLREDPSDPEKCSHEVIISDKKNNIAFSLLKTKNLEEAVSKIGHFQEIFPSFVEAGLKDMYTKSMMQNVVDIITNFPSYKIAHIAVMLGLSEVMKHEPVKSYLEEPEEKYGSYPIHIAVEIGNEEAIETLIACGVSLEVTDSMGNTPMHIAASKSVKVIQALLPSDLRNLKNSLINPENFLKETPLSMAVKAEHWDNIKALIILGANVNYESNIRPELKTKQFQDKLKMLGTSNDFNIKDLKYGGTLLHWATSREAIKLAVDLGCKLGLFNNRKETPLHVMVREDRMPCAVLLMSLGANPNISDEDGKTPLHLAAEILSVTNLQALISFGADVDIRNNNNETARHVASTVDSPRGREREKAIFVLEAVGAKCCHEKLESCNQRCLLLGKSRDISLMGEIPLQRSRWIFDDLLAKHQVSEAISEQKKNPPGLQGRILCMDGGGIKGLAIVQQLAVIEEAMGCPIHECFDWITGTSTGALFAVNLALDRPIEHTRQSLYSLRENIFVGSRPYDSGPLEEFLKKEFGETNMMSSIKNVKVNLEATLADRIPADLHIFRNYEAPIDILGITEDDSFVIPPQADKQYIWQALRASGAAPTFFSLPDKFVDGALIANNPVLDTLTEIEERNMALKLTGREEDMFHPTVVVSIGGGKHPTSSQVPHINLVMPSLLDVGKGMKAASNMILILLDQICSTEERTVDRARAWCSTRKVPYFRFNPSLSQLCSLDEKNDENLVKMMWETRSYMLSQADRIEQLKALLMPMKSE